MWIHFNSQIHPFKTHDLVLPPSYKILLSVEHSHFSYSPFLTCTSLIPDPNSPLSPNPISSTDEDLISYGKPSYLAGRGGHMSSNCSTTGSSSSRGSTGSRGGHCPGRKCNEERRWYKVSLVLGSHNICWFSLLWHLVELFISGGQEETLRLW